MQKLIELIRGDAEHRFLLTDHALFSHVDRNANRRRTRALAIAGLQHIQLAFLDGELEILHVLVMLLEIGGDLAQLHEGIRHHFLQVRNRLRGTDTSHHILALRVEQILAVEHRLAAARIAREAHARARLSSMLPNTMACTLAAVPMSSGIFSILR